MPGVGDQRGWFARRAGILAGCDHPNSPPATPPQAGSKYEYVKYWCPNCGLLRIRNLTYNQCPKCGAAVKKADKKSNKLHPAEPK